MKNPHFRKRVVLPQDPALFDRQVLLTPSDKYPTRISIYKHALTKGHAYLVNRFALGAPIQELLHQRAWLIDQILISAWQEFQLPEKNIALISVGGYGRCELHPHSDIDITLLIEYEIDLPLKKQIGSYLAFLWDIGLEVGHSVRTIQQCQESAAADITIATNLLEARLIFGEKWLFKRMREVSAPESIWPINIFFEAKLEEQKQRHHKYHDTAHKLEPNIKESPGGLRDIQTIAWVAKRHFGADTIIELVGHGFLTEQEFNILDECQNFLWRIRFTLHILSNRREDRLLFELQKDVAREFGYVDSDGAQLGVERFMKLYYRRVMEVSRLAEMLLQLFREAIIDKDLPVEIKPLNKRFQLRNDYLEVCHNNVFKHYPYALLEIFLLLQENPEIKGVRAQTIRLIRDHRTLVDDNFRNDIRTRDLFMTIIRHPNRLGQELQRMHRYGILETYLPVFEAVVGLMQFDLFHIYTVDMHTLFVIQNLHRFSSQDQQQDIPSLCTQLITLIPKPEILYLAGLFHDIAKGRGGDHSNLGAQFVKDFCATHQLSQYDTQLIAWLVENHLLMSVTSTRRDISDPEVINHFARNVATPVRLNYLYLLTVADIQGTNPSLWNSWKDALLSELYHSTLRALRRGVENPLAKQEWIAGTTGEALGLLATKLNIDEVFRVWRDLGEDYFLRHWPDEIAWHTVAIVNAKPEDLPLILVRPVTRRGGTEIFIYALDQDHIFAATTQALDQMGLTVLEARIMNSINGYTLDTYVILEASTNNLVTGEDRIVEIIAGLRDKLTCKSLATARVYRHTARQLKNFRIPTLVSFSDDLANHRTIMEVITTDRPGVLSQIATTLRNCGIRLQNAKIATFGERVEDIFYITDSDNQPIHHPPVLNALSNSISSALSVLN